MKWENIISLDFVAKLEDVVNLSKEWGRYIDKIELDTGDEGITYHIKIIGPFYEELIIDTTDTDGCTKIIMRSVDPSDVVSLGWIEKRLSSKE